MLSDIPFDTEQSLVTLFKRNYNRSLVPSGRTNFNSLNSRHRSFQIFINDNAQLLLGEYSFFIFFPSQLNVFLLELELQILQSWFVTNWNTKTKISPPHNLQMLFIMTCNTNSSFELVVFIVNEFYKVSYR